MKQLKLFLLLLSLPMIGYASPAVDQGILNGANQSGQALSTFNTTTDLGAQILYWIAYGTTTPSWGSVSLMSTVSYTMNIIALIVMAWLMVIGGATFVIQTANKGTPGGQVISSFWMPIRIVTATILLLPLPSGYSTLQYGVITIAEKGNSHANYVVEHVIDYLYDYGVYRSPALESGGSQITTWLMNELCMQYINSYTGSNTISYDLQTVTVPDGKDGTNSVVLQYKYNETKGNPTAGNPRINYCGAVSFTIPNIQGVQGTFANRSDATAAKTAGPALLTTEMAKVVESTRGKVAKIAQALLHDQEALKNLQAYGANQQSAFERARSEVAGVVQGSGADLAAVINEYDADTRKVITKVVNDLNSKKSLANSGKDSVGSWSDQIKSAGWPAFGAIFWTVNVNQGEINKLAASLRITVTPPSPDAEWNNDDRFKEVASRVYGAIKAYKASNPPLSPDTFDLTAIKDAGSEGEGFVDGAKSLVYRGFATVIKSAMYKNSDDDLILNMQYYGSALSTFAESAYWAKIFVTAFVRSAADTAVKAADSTNNAFLGAGNLFAPLTYGTIAGAGFISYAMQGLADFLGTLLIPLIIVGFTLAVVLPAIPLIQWLAGVISWMLFYTECLLVSPMWLSAHGTAEKEGWGSEHTRQGYMLMIGLYLNPILRVAGFSAIFMCMKPVGTLVALMFDYMNGVVVSGFTFLFVTLGALVLCAIFCYSAFVRIFSLPSELFERGLRWINGGQEVTGDSESEKTTRSYVAAFSSKGEHTAQMAGKNLMNPGAPGGTPGSPKPDVPKR
ncbi:TPA: DotA/TraY family protein [Pseudomonas aeruginosa]|nr:DotA/TraY family protein [Pseudomonas aeruginosa]